mgnify:CR=1 FL=1
MLLRRRRRGCLRQNQIQDILDELSARIALADDLEIRRENFVSMLIAFAVEARLIVLHDVVTGTLREQLSNLFASRVAVQLARQFKAEHVQVLVP